MVFVADKWIFNDLLEKIRIFCLLKIFFVSSKVGPDFDPKPIFLPRNPIPGVPFPDAFFGGLFFGIFPQYLSDF